MGDRTTKVTATLEASNYLAGMDKIAGKTKQVTDVTAEQAAALKTLASTGAIALGAIGAAAAGAATLAVVKFAEFDQAMSYVDAATHETAANMGLLRAAALDAGARTVFSATEAANAIEELGKAGLSTKDILGGGLDGALDLAAAGGISVADAAGYAATALNMFKLQGKDASHVADLLSAGAGKAMGSVDDLSQALNQGGLVAQQAGMSIEDTTGTLAAFASAGLLGSDAGTSLKTMLLSLEKPSTIAAATMKQYGLNVYDSQGKMLSMSAIAGQLQDKLGGLTDQQRNSALATIFGTDAVRSASVLYAEGAKGIQGWIDKTNDAGYASDTAARRLNNLKGDIEQLGGAFDTALIKSGSAANGVLRALTQGATDMVTAFADAPEWVQATALVVTALTGGVVLLGGGLLFLIPKIYETGTALTVLSTSQIPGVATAATAMLTSVNAAGSALGATAKFLVGPWGVALIVATLGVKSLGDYLDSLKASSDEITKSLQTSTSAADIFALAMKGRDADNWIAPQTIALSLSNLDHALDVSSDHAVNWWKRIGNTETNDAMSALGAIGDELAKLSDTDLPAAQRAFNLMAEETDGSKKHLWALLAQMPAYRDALIKQAEAQGLNVDKMTDAEKHHALLEMAQGKGASASAYTTSAALASADAYKAEADKASDLEDAISGLIDTINKANGVGQDAVSSNAAYQKSLADAQKTVDEYTKANGVSADALNQSTAAGATNAAMLADLAGKSQDAAKAALDAGGSADEYRAALDSGRKSIYDTALALTGNADAAQALTDKIYAMPSEKDIKILADTTAAKNALDTFFTMYNGRVIKASVQAAGTSRTYGFEDGGFLPGAPSHSDNMIIAAASGEHITRTAQAQIPDNKRALEFINAGGVIRGYAGGGEVGFQPAPVYTPAPPRQQYMTAPSSSGPTSAWTGNLNVSTLDPASTAELVLQQIGARLKFK